MTTRKATPGLLLLTPFQHDFHVWWHWCLYRNSLLYAELNKYKTRASIKRDETFPLLPVKNIAPFRFPLCLYDADPNEFIVETWNFYSVKEVSNFDQLPFKFGKLCIIETWRIIVSQIITNICTFFSPLKVCHWTLSFLFYLCGDSHWW